MRRHKLQPEVIDLGFGSGAHTHTDSTCDKPSSIEFDISRPDVRSLVYQQAFQQGDDAGAPCEIMPLSTEVDAGYIDFGFRDLDYDDLVCIFFEDPESICSPYVWMHCEADLHQVVSASNLGSTPFGLSFDGYLSRSDEIACNFHNRLLHDTYASRSDDINGARPTAMRHCQEHSFSGGTNHALQDYRPELTYGLILVMKCCTG